MIAASFCCSSATQRSTSSRVGARCGCPAPPEVPEQGDLRALKIAVNKLRCVVIRRHGRQFMPRGAGAVKQAQNSLLTARPRTLSGPWSSRPSVAWSSFCKVSLAFL